MLVNIKCSTFLRIASICNFFEPECDPELKRKINTVRLEIAGEKLLAIATNQKIAAIEKIAYVHGKTDEHMHVNLDPALINQCKAESFLDGYLTINTIPEIASAVAQTSSGWAFNGNPCHWFDDTPLDNWRDWIPDEPVKKSEGIMMWNLHHVESLIASSPSGKVIFPEFINARKPLVMRDREDDNWVGVFIPKPHGEIQKTAAEIPEWWGK